MIETRGLVKRFGSFEALHGIDLSVPKGEIYGFLGHNGAGKSTTMNILAGLSRPSEGSVSINGHPLTNATQPGELGLGYLPEDPRFYPWMSAKEALGFYIDKTRYPGKDHARRVEEIIEWVGLKQDARRRIGGYSRGMKQRLGLGVALLNDPALLLLDEPSSALDPAGRKDVLLLIQDLKSMGKTVFLSTHILDDAERVCDRVSILSRGRIVLEDTLASLKQRSIRPQLVIGFKESLAGQQKTKVQTDIEALPGIQDVEDTPYGLLVRLLEETKGKRAVFSYLGNSALDISEVRQEASSLEDIFIAEVNNHA